MEPDHNSRKPPFASVAEAIEDIRQGRMIVLVDDEDRENEGDLAMAAEKVTPEAINFMAKYGRGLICLALTEQRCEMLNLSPISPRNTSAFGTPFCEPIDARRGTTTGTSPVGGGFSSQVRRQMLVGSHSTAPPAVVLRTGTSSTGRLAVSAIAMPALRSRSCSSDEQLPGVRVVLLGLLQPRPLRS